MSRMFISLLIAGAALLAQGQAANQNQQPTATAKGPAAGAKAQVKASAAPKSGSRDQEAVMTIRGVCDGRTPKGAPCVTIVTKRQFETLMAALQSTGQNIVPPQRRDVAQAYAELLMLSNAAKKAGTDKDPRYADLLEFTRMRALADMYKLQLEEEARRISDADIEAYYKQNLDKFEELTMRRITLPRNNWKNLQDLDYRAKAEKAAQEFHERAAQGEDIDKLQKEVYDLLEVYERPKTGTLMEAIRRGLYDPRVETHLFALKPGEVTQVIDQPSAYIIFKLESRRTIPLDEAKTEIHKKLSQEKLDRLHKETSMNAQLEFNDQYFGPKITNAWVPIDSIKQGNGNKGTQTPVQKP